MVVRVEPYFVAHGGLRRRHWAVNVGTRAAPHLGNDVAFHEKRAEALEHARVLRKALKWRPR
jgi:hypothetical protein